MTTAALSDGVKVVEDFAKSALESKKLDFPTFEKLASLVRQHLKSSLSRARPFMTQDTQSSSLVFGAWVHGGLFGITKKTLSQSWLCKYINAFVEKSSPKGFTWTSFVFNFNGKARLHSDKYNLKDSYNLTFSFGDYTQVEHCGFKAPVSWDPQRSTLMTKVKNTWDTIAIHIANSLCCIHKQNMLYNPTRANVTLLSPIHQGGSTNW